jgi:hypothetical protein
MKVYRLAKFILSLGFTIIIVGKSSAQLTDYHYYPITTTPGEKKDSTRGHVWGYVFGSAYDKVHADSVNVPATNGKANAPVTSPTQYSSVPNNFSAISIQRIYLGYDYFFNNQFSVHIVLAHEEYYDGGTTAATKDNVDNVGDRSLYIKFCSFEWDNIFKGSNLTVGGIQTPGYPITEDPIWGYRPLERSAMDMRGIVSSNDVGVNLGGKFWSQKDVSGKENAVVGYNIMVGNNTNASPDNVGINTADVSNFKRYYGDLYARLLGDKLVFDLYSDYHTVTPGQNDFVWRGLIGYKARNYNISFEYFNENMSNQAVYTPNASDKTIDTGAISRSGISIEGAIVLSRDKHTQDPKFSLVARYDLYNPNANFNANYVYAESTSGPKVSNTNYNYSGSNAYTEQFFLLALDYQPINQIHLMPNIWYDGFNNRNNGVKNRAASDYDLVPRLTFYYTFYK